MLTDGPCLLTDKRIQVFKTKCLTKLLGIYFEHKTKDWVQSRSASMLVHRNLFWQLSRDGHFWSHSMTACPKPSFMAPWSWRVDDTVISRRNAGWTTSRSGHLCPCQNCSRWPPAEKTGRGSLLNCPLFPPDDPFGQGMELILTWQRLWV